MLCINQLFDHLNIFRHFSIENNDILFRIKKIQREPKDFRCGSMWICQNNKNIRKYVKCESERTSFLCTLSKSSLIFEFKRAVKAKCQYCSFNFETASKQKQTEKRRVFFCLVCRNEIMDGRARDFEIFFFEKLLLFAQITI